MRSMVSQKTNVLVTGVGGGGVGEGIVKALKLDSKRYRIVATDMNAMSATLWRVDRAYLVPAAFDPEYVDRMLYICEKERISAVIPGSVPELRKLSTVKDEFEQRGVKVIVGPRNVIGVCLDKWKTFLFLKENGFPCPKTFLSEDMANAMSELGFPVFVKPREGYGSRYTYVVRDKEELNLIAAYLRKNEVEFIVQEFVDAKECTVGVVASKSSRILGSISIIREMKTGFSYRMTVVDVRKAREIGEKISLKLGVTGPLNVQFFITEQSPIVIELNPRFSGTTPVRSAVGFKEVDAVLRNYLFGEEMSLNFKKGVIAIRHLDEVYASLSALNELQQRGYIARKGLRKRYF